MASKCILVGIITHQRNYSFGSLDWRIFFLLQNITQMTYLHHQNFSGLHILKYKNRTCWYAKTVLKFFALYFYKNSQRLFYIRFHSVWSALQCTGAPWCIISHLVADARGGGVGARVGRAVHLRHPGACLKQRCHQYASRVSLINDQLGRAMDWFWHFRTGLEHKSTAIDLEWHFKIDKETNSAASMWACAP